VLDVECWMLNAGFVSRKLEVLVNDSRFWLYCVRSGTHGGMDRLVDITIDVFGHLGGWTGVLVLSHRVGGMERCIGDFDFVRV
jgi:hypothetical protein